MNRNSPASTSTRPLCLMPTDAIWGSTASTISHTATLGFGKSFTSRPATWATQLLTPGTRRWVFTSAMTDTFLRERERSEEHTSELQSRLHLVCRLLLEKKKILL